MSTVRTDLSRYASPKDRFVRKSLVLSDGRNTATLDLILTTCSQWARLPESQPGSGWFSVFIPWGMTLGLRVEV